MQAQRTGFACNPSVLMASKGRDHFPEDPVTCREFADFIADYLDGQLPADVLARFEHHLTLCVNCLRYLDGYRATVKLGKAAFATPDAAVPRDIPEDLVRAILVARRGSH